MEASLGSILSGLSAGEGLGELFTQKGKSSEGRISEFQFSAPAFSSSQLREKWSGGWSGNSSGNNGGFSFEGSVGAAGSFGGANGSTGHCGVGFCGTGGGSFSDAASSAISSLNQTDAHTAMVDGKVAFENANYDITISDRGEIKVHNKNTDENYRIWGDPHVDVDGKRAFDFKGDTTFVLDDGTKISIETTPWRGNNGQTISSKVSIIDGNSSYGLHVTGVDDNHTGDLQFTEVPNFGHFLDSMVDDGNYVHENPEGKGFIAVGKDGWTEVDQSVMDFIENTPERLGLPDLFADLESQLPENPLEAFLMGAGLKATVGELGGFMDGFLGDQIQTQVEPQEPSLFETLDSLLSLVKQQSKPFGYMSGLSEITTTGQYEVPNAENPFHFTLNFYRS